MSEINSKLDRLNQDSILTVQQVFTNDALRSTQSKVKELREAFLDKFNSLSRSSEWM